MLQLKIVQMLIGKLLSFGPQGEELTMLTTEVLPKKHCMRLWSLTGRSGAQLNSPVNLTPWLWSLPTTPTSLPLEDILPGETLFWVKFPLRIWPEFRGRSDNWITNLRMVDNNLSCELQGFPGQKLTTTSTSPLLCMEMDQDTGMELALTWMRQCHVSETKLFSSSILWCHSIPGVNYCRGFKSLGEEWHECHHKPPHAHFKCFHEFCSKAVHNQFLLDSMSKIWVLCHLAALPNIVVYVLENYLNAPFVLLFLSG